MLFVRYAVVILLLGLRIIMKLFRVIVPVTDVERAAAFYGQLLAMPGRRVSPGRHYFDCGGVILACYDPAADGDEVSEPWRLHPNHIVYFAVSNLDKVHRRAATAGLTELTDIARQPWGERSFYGRDPFGNGLCFVDENTCFTGEPGRGRPHTSTS